MWNDALAGTENADSLDQSCTRFSFHLMAEWIGSSPTLEHGLMPSGQPNEWQARVEHEMAAVHAARINSGSQPSQTIVSVSGEGSGKTWLAGYICSSPFQINVSTTNGHPCDSKTSMFDTMCKQYAQLELRKLNPLAFVIDLDAMPAAVRAEAIDAAKELATGRVITTARICRMDLTIPVEFVPPPVILILTAQILPGDQFEGTIIEA